MDPDDRDRPPTYQWAVLIVATVIVCLVLGALMTIGAIKLAEGLN